jgi:hypothetical protein
VLLLKHWSISVCIVYAFIPAAGLHLNAAALRCARAALALRLCLCLPVGRDVPRQSLARLQRLRGENVKAESRWDHQTFL